MPPGVGSGIRYMTVGGVVGAGCIPLPVPETYPDPHESPLNRPPIRRADRADFSRASANASDLARSYARERRIAAFATFGGLRWDSSRSCRYFDLLISSSL